jgi:hypothetical protein
MGLGEPIGYSARVSQNNNGLYQNQVNNFMRGIHIALMGDPTIRLHQVAPPSGLQATTTAGSTKLTWTASPDAGLGYHIYRGNSSGYTRLSSTPVSALTFTDASPVSGTSYMVRAVKLENTPSGSYTNQSQGVFAAATAGSTIPTAKMSVIKTPTGPKLTWPSQLGQTYQVYVKTKLTDTIWAPASASIAGTATTCTWTDTSGATTRFYRIMSL